MNWHKLNPHSAFWYGAAISIVMVSMGICFSLIRGSEFNVEALDTKLELSGITSKNKELTRELKEVSKELKSKPNLPSYQREEIEEIELELEQAEQEIEKLENKITEDDHSPVTELENPANIRPNTIDEKQPNGN